MKKIILFVVATIANCSILFGQQNDRPYKCGFYSKNIGELRQNYDNYGKYCNVKPTENVASIGASNGYAEVQISVFTDSINWTIQDIDTNCLNQNEFDNVLRYHEKLKGGPIIGQFVLVQGQEKKTNLKRDFYDRILLLNVYHELSEKEIIISDIKGALKKNGFLIIAEKMATKPGQHRSDCGKLKPFEPSLINDLKRYKFNLINKVVANEKTMLIYYEFRIE